MLTKEQAIEILEKFDFFQGQRAGRELWSEKPFDVQEQDIENFQKDVSLLMEYINTADVVPKSEVFLASSDAMKMLIEIHGYAVTHDEDIRREVAREIFREFDNMIELVSAMTGLDIIAFGKYAELKKKYTEDQTSAD